MIIEELKKELKSQSNEKKAKVLQGFFKTKEGEYGEGDIFLGVGVPEQRKIVKKFWKEISPSDIRELLSSEIHEERLTALLVLIEKYKVSDSKRKKEIFNFYLKNTCRVNNWDLVDLSAPKIVGDFLLDNPSEKNVLYLLTNSDDLWKKRIAIVSCFSFIKMKEFDDCLKISEILLNDKHNLIHKAVGWMLREVGKRDVLVLENFLKKHYKDMPRTMLRYAIERFDEGERKKYLDGMV